jgi:hypothetical protein
MVCDALPSRNVREFKFFSVRLGPENRSRPHACRTAIVEKCLDAMRCEAPQAGCCDTGTLAKIVADPSQRTPETAQLVHLLDGLNNYAKQLGAKLLIYDLPFVPRKKKKKKKSSKRIAPT